MSPKLTERLGPVGLMAATAVVLLALASMLLYLVVHGARQVSWEFLTQAPNRGMVEGGIWPAILGTSAVTLVCAALAIPLGLGAAIYLVYYAGDGPGPQVIRAAVRNLAGVPSVVYGLFGAALFVHGLGFGPSILAAGCTLGLLSLPWTITASEEALRSVPTTYRDAALALGAGNWHMIRTVMIPPALPGILTGIILALSRAAGETAPLLVTGVVFFQPTLPRTVFDSFMALPYHLYILATQHENPDASRPAAFGTALVLVGIVLLSNLSAFVLRAMLRRKYLGQAP